MHRHPIATQPGEAPPPFADDPLTWLRWVDERVRARDLDAIAAQPAARHDGPNGERWRCVRTDDGVELRPALVNGFLRVTPNPLVSAIQLGRRVVVELSSTEGSWVGTFEPDELDIVALGEAMLGRRHLPHDNLRLLFGRSD